MARVTVEDCILRVENRFDLVLLASHRARSLHNGEEATIPRDNDKAPVVALREIGDETISIDNLKEDFIKSLQVYYEDEDENEEISIKSDETIMVEEDNEDNTQIKEDEKTKETKEDDDTKEAVFENIEKENLEKDSNINFDNPEDNVSVSNDKDTNTGSEG